MQSIGDVLANVLARGTLPPRVAEAVSVGLEQANDNLAEEYSRLFYNHPWRIADILLDSPIWPCGHTLVELSEICRRRRAAQKNASSHESICLRACDKALARIIDEAARAGIEGEDRAA